MRRRGWGIGVLLALAVGACQGTPVAPSAIVPSSATAEPAPPTAAELEAIRFRQDYGLRASLEHVRAVAANPRSVVEFGVQLLPEEVLQLELRADSQNDISKAVLDEAEAHPDDYCGSYIERTTGAYTSMWRNHLLGHSAAIRFRVGPAARVAFVECRYSQPEQEAAMEAIRALGDDWLEELPAVMMSYGWSTIDNVLQIEISSAALDATDRVRDRYMDLLSLPADAVRVTSDGTGAALVPWGEVRVTAVDGHGDRVRDTLGRLLLEGMDGSGPGHCGGGDVGFGIGSSGVGTLPCQIGIWTIAVVSDSHTDAGWTILGSDRVKVREGETTNVTIVVKDPPTK